MWVRTARVSFWLSPSPLRHPPKGSELQGDQEPTRGGGVGQRSDPGFSMDMPGGLRQVAEGSEPQQPP